MWRSTRGIRETFDFHDLQLASCKVNKTDLRQLWSRYIVVFAALSTYQQSSTMNGMSHPADLSPPNDGVFPTTTATIATHKPRHSRIMRKSMILLLIPLASYLNILTSQKDLHNVMLQPLAVWTTDDREPTPTPTPQSIPNTKQRRHRQRRRSRSLPQPPVNRTITILLQFKGELGNHLSVIAGAYVTQLQIQKLYPYIHIQFIGQHQDHPKWTRAVDDIRQCFPKIYELFPIYDGGLHDPVHYHVMAQQQKSWLNSRQSRLLRNVHDDGSIHLLHRLLDHQQQGRAPTLMMMEHSTGSSENDTSSSGNSISTAGGKYNYSLPFLIADEFYWGELLKDMELYQRIRELFVMNETACCSREPLEHDIIYHHRNFKYEVREEQSKKFGTLFQEVTAYTASHHLFINHTIQQPNDTNDSDHPKKRVAILSRSLDGLEEYQLALNETNHLPSYIVHNTESASDDPSGRASSGITDFCFIMKSRRDNEIIGKLHSTFVQWSSLLSQAATVRLYTINDTPVEQNHTMKVLQQLTIDERQFSFEEYWQPLEP